VPDIGKPEQRIAVELTIKALDSDEEASTVLISKTDAEIAFAEAISKLGVQGPLNEQLQINGVFFGGFRVIDPYPFPLDTVEVASNLGAVVITMGNMAETLRAVRDRLTDFDDEDLEIGLLHQINMILDDDPFSVRLTEEMWKEYKTIEKLSSLGKEPDDDGS